MAPKFTNNLIKETSPYLLQHAHNPVQWEGWSSEILKKAQKQDKLLLISIGYSACHWCHVMEHECFEDEEVAEIMNKHFVNIKIDREERPDIDHIYMDALQMMTGSGGWPLNIVALPDGRPFWGATYVRKNDWIKVLDDLSALYKTSPGQVLDYAQNMAQGIKQINLIPDKKETNLYEIEHLKEDVSKWYQYFDTFLGGYKRAPKFPMPVNLNFLLHFGVSLKDSKIMEYVETTLTRMAYGGIFDHVGGGFSRYSVDTKWHIPHFEKMLYDNGQLVSLYSKAFAATENNLYKETVEKSIHFITHELMSEEGGFYSSLDADSLDDKGQLMEGAYYVWNKNVLQDILEEDYAVFEDYYNINSYGFWEHENYVLIRDSSDEEIAKKHNLSVSELRVKIDRRLKQLELKRNQRNKPRLDDKILTSWNGLMLKALTDAYKYVQNPNYLDYAIKNGKFIRDRLLQSDGTLYRNYKNGKRTINGYLEDYASVIDAYIGLYEISFDEEWLNTASKLTEYCLENFFDTKSGLFFFSSKDDEFIIRRTLETEDNVIPASNSIMAHNLFKLSKFFPKKNYMPIYSKMLKNIQDNFSQNTQSHSNWLDLVLFKSLPFFEVAIVGSHFKEKALELMKSYMPNTVYAGTYEQSEHPLLKNRFREGVTSIYICEEGSCQLPLTQTEEALTHLL